MQDRFIFRVWSKQDKQYLDDNFFLTLNGELGCYIKECSLWGLLENNDLYIIEQCTGIKDCNGKLIFEGDILRFNGIFIDCYVIFKNGAFEYTIWEENKISYRLNTVIAKSTQIIGNIHEMEKYMEKEK